MLQYETAGDPISGLKWTRKTTEKISDELAKIGIKVSKNTVGKLLKGMGYSLKVNQKKIATGGKKSLPKNRKIGINNSNILGLFVKYLRKKNFL